MKNFRKGSQKSLNIYHGKIVKILVVMNKSHYLYSSFLRTIPKPKFKNLIKIKFKRILI
jgi:hypothetical protein